MGEYERRMGGRRYRRRRLHGSSRGVVSVVGTLLALLVFLSLFGVFLQQYLPLWMIDNESAFTAQTQTSLATLKSNVDLQAALGGPPVYATPFTMSSQGVPVLAQPTAGVMNFIPSSPGVFANVSMTPGPGGGPKFFQNFSLGVLTMALPNRYYSQQTFQFEDDAVIQAQSLSQQLMLYPPGFSLNVSGTEIGVTMTLLQLLGNATQAVSTGSQEVYSHFAFAQSFQSNTSIGGLTATFLLGTHYSCAWTKFLQQQFSAANLGAHAVISPSKCVSSIAPHMMTVTFTGLTTFRLVLAEFTLVVGVGVE